MMQQIAISVTDNSQIGEARRAAAAIASRSNMNETESGRVAIIVSELATNLVRYSQKGNILIRGELQEKGAGTVEILAIDSGPGMDFARCAMDGYSTGGTAGNGLGAVRRLTDEFDVYSVKPTGTVLLASVKNVAARDAASEKMQWGSISFPAPGETLCGDTFRYQDNGLNMSLMIADGLGHGPDAARASMCAATVFESDPFTDVAAFLQTSNSAMAGTRGAAVAIAEMDGTTNTIRYAGVGNISGTFYSGSTRRGLPSHNGIVGAILPRVRPYEIPSSDTGMIIMHSDGLQTRWSLDTYPGLSLRHPAVIAGVLFRDFYRGRDDVTIVIGSWRGAMS